MRSIKSKCMLDRDITLVAAMDKTGAIGKDNKLLWSLPSDLYHFKLLTLKGTVVMGRRTYESIGRALPDRRNIILSRDMRYRPRGEIVARSIDELFRLTTPDEKLFVIGGGEIYSQLLPHVRRLVVTEVDAEINGDTYMPEFKNDPSIREIYRVTADDDPRDDYRYDIVYYERS